MMSIPQARLAGLVPDRERPPSVTELPTLEEVHAFLLGTGSIDGKWFGEGDSGRPYWWRKFLREAIASRPTPDLGEDEELVERLTYLIQFHVYAEAEARDVQCVIDSLSERDGWTASGGWIIVKEDDWNNSQDRLEALHAEREKLAYHAEQLATYIAQPAVSEKHLASARWHNDQIRAALSGEDSPDAP
jgi:hypothetical protein